MKLINKGAEGDIYITKWYQKKAILKIRKKKYYRNSILDLKIRKQRTIREAQIISEVKSFGINAPLLYFVDVNHFNIIMEYLSGDLVRDLSDEQIEKLCEKIGKVIGTMHKHGIMHGDITTSNFILQDKELFVIDFGLAIRSNKSKDHAVDLRLFKEILTSAHTHIMYNGWKKFQLGYKNIVGNSRFTKIISLVSLIESRGRYATVV